MEVQNNSTNDLYIPDCLFPTDNQFDILKEPVKLTPKEIAILYLPLTKYVEKDIFRAIGRYKGLIIKSKMSLKQLKHIICIADNRIVLDLNY